MPPPQQPRRLTWQALAQALKECFSSRVAANHEAELYFEAATGLFVAVLVIGGVLWFVGSNVPNGDRANLWLPILRGRGWVHFLSFGAFFVCCVSVVHKARNQHLSYRYGTLSTALAFLIILSYVSAIVRATGGIYASIYGTSFVSLLGAC